MTRHLFSGFRWASARPAHAFFFVLLMAVTVLVSACGSPPADPPAGQAGGGAAPAMPVEVITLAEKPIERVAEFVGTIKSRRSTNIQPQAEGILTGILVKSGDCVSPGTPMFEIDSASQQALVSNLESLLAAREADAGYAKQQAQRAKTLLDVGATSQQELEQAETLQKTAEAQVKAVEAQIRQQRNELAYYRLVSTTSGVVGDIPVRQGERVTRTTVLTSVDDLGAFEVYIGVPVQQAPSLKTGLAVRILGDNGEVIATERISFIAPSVDDATQTVLVKTPLQSAGSRFRTEQFVRVQVVFDTAPGVTLPIVAATRVSGQYFAFVAEKSGQGMVARQRAVTVGTTVGNEYVVLSGLKAGEQLIVSGVQKVGDGAPVMPMPARGRGPEAGAAAGGRMGGA